MFWGTGMSVWRQTGKQTLLGSFQIGIQWFCWTNKTHDRMLQNGFLLTSLHQLWLVKDSTCWAHQGLTAVSAGGSSVSAFAAAPLRGEPDWEKGSPHPTNSCWAARSWEKAKQKSKSLFHPCCCYTNKSIERRSFQPLDPSQSDSDQKPLLGWLFSDKARGKEFEWCDTGSQGVDVSIARDWQPQNNSQGASNDYTTLQEIWVPHTSTASAASLWEQHTRAGLATFSCYFRYRVREWKRSWLICLLRQQGHAKQPITDWRDKLPKAVK